MIQFLQPIWIGAFTGIALPVIIHLWNVRKGKTLKVGNIDFLVKKSATGIGRKISDLPLFIIRCLLVLVLMFLLMEPFFEKNENAGDRQGWLLIPKENLKEAYALFPKTIDSLLALGYQFHLFEKNFPPGSLSDSPGQQPGTAARSSYWTLLKELNRELPSTTPVYIISSGTREHFNGARPVVALSLQWKTFTPKQDNAKKMPGTVPVNICIFSDRPAPDINYLSAAINAIGNNTGQPVALSYAGDAERIPGNTQWLFWLSEKKLLATHPGRNVLVWEKGTIVTGHTALLTGFGNNSFAGKEPALFKWVAHKNDPALLPVWINSYGEPIIARECLDNDTVYHFYSRFDPQWTDIVWDVRFPRVLYDLLFGAPESQDKLAANVPLEQQQVFPVIAKDKTPALKKYRAARTDLVFGSWLFLLALFLLERILSFKTKKEALHG